MALDERQRAVLELEQRWKSGEITRRQYLLLRKEYNLNVTRPDQADRQRANISVQAKNYSDAYPLQSAVIQSKTPPPAQQRQMTQDEAVEAARQNMYVRQPEKDQNTVQVGQGMTDQAYAKKLTGVQSGKVDAVTFRKEQTVVRKPEEKSELNPAQEKRVENLVQREKRLETFKQGIYERLGIDEKPEDKKTSVKGVAKAVARAPVEIASMPVFLGGRAAFVADAATTKQGRQELSRAAKETPGAVLRSYDPRTSSGIVNIGLTALTLKSTAGAIKSAKSKPTFMTEESGTLRTTTPKRTLDTTRVSTKVLQGKEVIEVKGTIKSEMFRIPGKKYGVKGSGVLTDNRGKTTNLEIRGVGTKVKGGYDVVSAIKSTRSGKTEVYADVTQSATLIKEPVLGIKTLSRTVKTVKGRSIYESEPSSISTGITREPYVERIGTTGKNFFRTKKMTESGKVASTEQLLFTDRIGVDAKTFTKEFTGARKFDYSRTAFERKSFDSSTGASAAQKTTTTTLSRTAPTQGQTVLNVARTLALSTAKSVKVRQVSGLASKSSVITGLKLGSETRTEQVQATGQVLKVIPTSRPKTEITSKIKQDTAFDTKPTESVTTITAPSVISRPKLSTATSVGQTTRPKIAQSSQFSLTTPMRPVALALSPTAPTSPGMIVPPLTPFLGLQNFKTKSERKTFSQARKYRPSIYGLSFNIKRSAAPRVLTGFEVRGV